MRTFIQRVRDLWNSSEPEARIQAFAEVTGEPVSDLRFYEEAMRHRSLLRERAGANAASNERLEFLGDAILGFITADDLFAKFPDQDEGYMTRLRAKLVSGAALAKRASEIGLGELVSLSENMSQLKGHKNASILADAYEALIGAIYLDQGMDAARRFVHRTALDPVDLESLARKDENYKSQLLEFAQARGWPQPVYQVIDTEGPSHRRRFTVEAMVDGKPMGSAEAGSKKRAEQRAAKAALDHLHSGGTTPPE